MIKCFRNCSGVIVARRQGTISVAPSAHSRAAAGLRVVIAALASVAALAGPAGAQGRVEATYRASLAGIPIGSGSWIIDIGPKQYAGAASGRASGLVRILVSGEGSSTVRGTIKQGRLIPSVFAASIHSHDSYEIHMEMSGGNVKTLKNDPPLVESPDRIPLTDAHRRGILDPMTALMITVPGNGEVVSNEACQAKLPIFDGRQRFDLVLSFKRMETVESEKGYRGSAVVCSASYVPIAGHRPGRYVIRYLQETRDMEIWLAPIAGTRVLIPYRVSVPTLFGNAILQAAQFETEAQLPAPTRAANPSQRAARGS
ncbi:MAG: DUF3108 domain-containing protein [Hyphomicrobiales bacterium]|nr:DUF3108 domain-containing protein [Hyphomicrobiales bacterium]MBV9428151.1 DUF3108 domain-containing protein [Bradyrhizobiaceae bacterium]